MTNEFAKVSQLILVGLVLLYTVCSYRVLCMEEGKHHKEGYDRLMRLFVFLFHILSFALLMMEKGTDGLLGFFLCQLLVIQLFNVAVRKLYPGAARLLFNHISFFLVIGLLMLTRLDLPHAVRQFVIFTGSAVVTLPIPYIIMRMDAPVKYRLWYAVLGFLMLLTVFFAGRMSYGAKMSVAAFGLSFQPVELVRLLFVMFASGMLLWDASFKTVVLTSMLAAAHVVILILCRDLGSSLIFFVTYSLLLYAATEQKRYLLAAAGMLCVAGTLAYMLFPHVSVRLNAWKDPFSDIANKGYQMAQSLFAIGSGGLFGTGIAKGMPDRIPIVGKDFIFAAIAEELGVIAAVSLIALFLNCFLYLLKLAGGEKERFSRLVTLGFALLYIIQVFLTVGGAVKFIPSTGMTLPFMAYGGSSLLSSSVLFMMVQGIYMREIRELQETAAGREKSRNGKFGGRAGAVTIREEEASAEERRAVRNIAFAVTLIFLWLSCYLLSFVLIGAKNILNNPYNPRI